MTEADLNWTVGGEAAFSAVDSTTVGTGTEVGTGVGTGLVTGVGAGSGVGSLLIPAGEDSSGWSCLDLVELWAGGTSPEGWATPGV